MLHARTFQDAREGRWRPRFILVSDLDHTLVGPALRAALFETLACLMVHWSCLPIISPPLWLLYGLTIETSPDYCLRPHLSIPCM